MKKIIIIFFLLFLNISYSQINPVWQVSFNDSIAESNYAVKSKIDHKDNIVILARGTNSSLGTGVDFILIKYNGNGEKLWNTRFDGTGHSSDYPADMVIDKDNNIYVTGRSWGGFDSTASNQYIDSTEDLLYSFQGGGPPPDNLFYYAVAIDNSYKASINSDTIAYPAYVCPTFEGEIGPRPFFGNTENENPKSYYITNYPNPFNPSTKIYYSIPVEGNIKNTIYNSIGQKITELVNEFKNIGSYEVEFNGGYLASGIYYYKIEAGNFVQTKKMLLIK